MWVLGYLFSKASIPSVIRDPQSLLPSLRMPAGSLRFYCSQLCCMQSFVPLPIDTSSHSIYCLVVLARTSGLRCEGLISEERASYWAWQELQAVTRHSPMAMLIPPVWEHWELSSGKAAGFCPFWHYCYYQVFFFLNLLIWWILLTFNY